jgi:hypothetical protein
VKVSANLTHMKTHIHVLVVANEALESPELVAALQRRSEHSPLRVFLLAPATEHERPAAHQRLEQVVRRLAVIGIEATGIIGDSDAVFAVRTVWNPMFYDEMVVCTFPPPASTWLRIDLVGRLAGLTGATVSWIQAAVTASP